MTDTIMKKSSYSSYDKDIRSVVFHLIDNNLSRYDFENSINSLGGEIELLGYSADLGQSRLHLIIRGYDKTSVVAFRLLKKNLLRQGLRGKIKLVGSTPLQLYLKGTNILTSSATELLTRTGNRSNMVVGVLFDRGPLSETEAADALGRLEVRNPRTLIEEALAKGLVVLRHDKLEPSDSAKRLLNGASTNVSPANIDKFELKRTNGFVVHGDGSIGELELKTTLESLIKSGVDLDTSFRVVGKLQKILGSLNKPFIKADEISEFVIRELRHADQTGRLSRKYSRFMTGTYLVLNDKPLTRSQLKKEVEETLKKLELTATSGQISEISEDVIEALRRLCWNTEGPAFRISENLLAMLVEERLSNAPAVSLIRNNGKRIAVQKLRKESRLFAEKGLSIAKDRTKKDLPVRLGLEKLVEAGEKLFQSMLIESHSLPTGYPISDASLLITKSQHWKKRNKGIMHYCKRMISAETSENTKWETVEELLKVTLRFSSSLQ
jgi:hypothetical protein